MGYTLFYYSLMLSMTHLITKKHLNPLFTMIYVSYRILDAWPPFYKCCWRHDL